jgi:hypothetical protein
MQKLVRSIKLQPQDYGWPLPPRCKSNKGGKFSQLADSTCFIPNPGTKSGNFSFCNQPPAGLIDLPHKITESSFLYCDGSRALSLGPIYNLFKIAYSVEKYESLMKCYAFLIWFITT